MSKKVRALDTISGKIAEVPASYLSLPQFREHLVEVDENEKEKAPGKFKPTDAETYKERKSEQKKMNEPKADKKESDSK